MRRNFKQPFQLVTNISAAQPDPVAATAGTVLPQEGGTMVFHVDIPGSATVTVRLWGRIDRASPWALIDTVTASGIRAHHAVPQVMATVFSYSGSGNVNVWVNRNDQ